MTDDRRRVRLILLMWMVVASVVAGAICVIGWAHDPQTAFRDPQTGRLDLAYLLYLFFTWFLTLFLSGGGTSVALYKLVRFVGRVGRR